MMTKNVPTTEKLTPKPAVSIIQDSPYVVVISHGLPLLRFEDAELIVDDEGLKIIKDGMEITSMGAGRHEGWQARITGVELTPNL